LISADMNTPHVPLRMYSLSSPVLFIHRNRFPLLPQQRYRLFIHTNHRFPFVIGPKIHFKNVFHRRCKGRVLFQRYTPAFLHMRLIQVFFNRVV
jgi:hypothetical protein